jgi:hypothetical protein
MNRNSRSVVPLIVLLAAGAAWSAEPNATAPDSPPAAADPLAGPRVREGGSDRADGAPTLIERTFEGKLKRYDTRIEEAAAERLDLSPAEREEVSAILAARAAKMDGIVRENVELLLKGLSARESGDRTLIRENLLVMSEKFGDLADRGGLLDELADALPTEKADELRAMVQEYWRALIEEETAKQRRDRVKFMEDAPAGEEPGEHGVKDEPAPDMDSMPNQRAGGTRAGSRQVLTRLALEEFGREIRRSYDRIAQDGQKRLDEVIKQLALTPEQESRVRQIVLQHAQESKLNPGSKQKTKLFFDVLRELSPEQRRTFMELAREGR